jgi:hypothetical protein
LWSRLILGLYFGSNVTGYRTLLEEWALVSTAFSGWNLEEVKSLSPRERTNWLEIAKFFGKVSRKSDG